MARVLASQTISTVGKRIRCHTESRSILLSPGDSDCRDDVRSQTKRIEGFTDICSAIPKLSNWQSCSLLFFFKSPTSAQEARIMPQTICSPETLTGVPELDELHRDLFTAMDGLANAADPEFCTGYEKFIFQLEQAFRKEEEWMDDVDFPAFRAHQEQHARVLSGLHAIYARVTGGDAKLGREAIEKLLPQWFAFHISTMDMALACAMQVAELDTVPTSAYRTTQTAPYALAP
jgi:hemerythrin